MPNYTLICPRKHTREEFMTFSEYDALVEGTSSKVCESCGVECRPISVNPTVFYGAWRIDDKDFRDAEEASGIKIKSTKDIDKLEKAGKMYRITNPSQYKTNNRKIKV